MESFAAFGGMIVAVMVQTANMIVNKAAMSQGSNKFIVVVYANALSTLILLPSAFVFHKSSERPLLTFSLLCRFFMLAVFGCLSQIFGFVGIEYSSATLGTAMLNLIPAFTFILAIIFRMEKVYWRSSSSQAKIWGTIVSIAGALFVTFYKGSPIMPLSTSSQSNWVLGGLFLASDSFVTSLWYILQVSTLKKYPAVVFVVFFQCFFTTIMAAIFTLITIKEESAWELRLDMGLIAILYTAIFANVIRYNLITWCVCKAGALYCSMFKPLGIIFGVIMGVVFLGDPVYLGSLGGAVIIVAGFYAVLWGKAEEEKQKVEGEGLVEYSVAQNKVPLLQNKLQQEDKHSCTTI